MYSSDMDYKVIEEYEKINLAKTIVTMMIPFKIDLLYCICGFSH